MVFACSWQLKRPHCADSKWSHWPSTNLLNPVAFHNNYQAFIHDIVVQVAMVATLPV
jgi:hypothetical protein